LHDEREQLKHKIDEISRGFERLTHKIDSMPQNYFDNVNREVDEFRFKFSKVLNLSPDDELPKAKRV